MKLKLGTLKYNYTSRKALKRPANCMAKAEVYDTKTGRQKYLLVVDYYSPRKGKRAGWYIALRKPGKVMRQRPQLCLFLKDGYDCPKVDVIEDLLTHIIF